MMATGNAPELSLDDLRSVDAFRGWMIHKLDQNRHKGNRAGWMNVDRFPDAEITMRLLDEAIELIRAVNAGDTDAILREAADVANFAMMIADRTGALRTLKP
jgi:phosphoribosyl-ATP pyrophosphohydrolase